MTEKQNMIEVWQSTRKQDNTTYLVFYAPYIFSVRLKCKN